MGVAALHRWLPRWQEIHLVSAFRIYCAHTKSAFRAHIACLIWHRLTRFMAGSFTADLYRYWAFEASRKFTSCLHTWHKTALLSIPDRWQHKCSSLHPPYWVFRSSVKMLGHETSSDNLIGYNNRTNTKYFITLSVNRLKPSFFGFFS